MGKLSFVLVVTIYLSSQAQTQCLAYFSKGSSMPPRSNQMDQLYGETISKQVYERLQDLDPELNILIQQIAYDVFWSREGLSVKQKSLVTVLTLFALQKEEQTRIHLNGFFSSSGKVSEVYNYLSSIEDLIGADSSAKAQAAVQEVIQNRGLAADTEALSDNLETTYARTVIFAAKGDLSNLKLSIQDYLDQGGEIETLRSTFIHMIVYAGFPTAMNSFAVLKQFRDKNE